MPVVHLTTNPGLEDVVEAELRRVVQADGATLGEVEHRPMGLSGHLRVTVPRVQPLLGLRTIHHVLEPLDRFDLDGAPLDQVCRRAAALDLAWLDGSFRVRCERRGEHSFGSPDVERAAGAGIVQATGAPVDLRDFAHQVRVEVQGQDVQIWRQHDRRALSIRPAGTWHQRITLGANVACALWLLTLGVDADPAVVADPCCGTGTLLREAAVLYPRARILGGDRHPRAAAGCRENMRDAGLSDRAHVVQADARDLAATWGEATLDAIATNPPYGVRMGEHLDFGGWYGALLRACALGLRPGGRLGLLVLKRHALDRALCTVPELRLRHARVIETGGIRPWLVVLERA